MRRIFSLSVALPFSTTAARRYEQEKALAAAPGNRLLSALGATVTRRVVPGHALVCNEIDALMMVVEQGASFTLLDNKYFRRRCVSEFPSGATVLSRNLIIMVALADEAFRATRPVSSALCPPALKRRAIIMMCLRHITYMNMVRIKYPT